MSAEQLQPILPGATIGVLGGGQLGRMMALAARRLGYRIVVLDPTPDSPCGQVADRQLVAAYADLDAARELAQLCDVVTYEFENVDADVTRVIAEHTRLPQGDALLRTTQHRIREKRALRAAGVATAVFLPVSTLSDLQAAAERLGYPFILKTSTGGYDGKGQWKIDSAADLTVAWTEAAAVAAVSPEAEDAPLEAEAFVRFAMELSVIVARNRRGEVKVYDVVENIHRDHILHITKAPAAVDSRVQAAARDMAIAVAEHLDLIGVMGVEMFLAEDGTVLVNELAPRPHNSGHYTLDAAITSQFEQHVLAVCNLPLGSVERTGPAVMVNVLGQHLPAVLAALPRWPGHWKLHLYGKADAKANRKMGHVTILGSVPDALQEIEQSGIWA